jgi:hypothetical protein
MCGLNAISHPVKRGDINTSSEPHCRRREKTTSSDLPFSCTSHNTWLCCRCGGVCSARWPSSYSRSATGETILLLFKDVMTLMLSRYLLCISFASVLFTTSTTASRLGFETHASPLAYSFSIFSCGHDAHASPSPLFMW